MNKRLASLAQQQATHCRIFGNSTRVMILWALLEDEMSVGVIAEMVGASLQNVSQHLSIMRDAQLLTSRREGQTIYYRINKEKLEDQCGSLILIKTTKEVP